MDREIKVTKCGNILACQFNDRVSIEFFPTELINLKTLFEARALASKDYDDQGAERELRDAFATARRMWKKARQNKNETKGDLLESGKDASVLPLYIGNSNELLSEIIMCTSISGMADFIGDMPRRLTLVRKLVSGERYTANYQIRKGKNR